MLCSLLARTDRERFESMVVALIDVLPLAERVEALGIPVRAMGMRRGVPDPAGSSGWPGSYIASGRRSSRPGWTIPTSSGAWRPGSPPGPP